MKIFIAPLLIIFFFSICLSAQQANTANTSAKQIAITFDDLPVAFTNGKSIEQKKELTRKLLKNITAHKAPAIGFVNEIGLFTKANSQKPDSALLDLLKSWLNAGLELGNHTYSHQDMNQIPLEQFEAETLKGEIYTKMLMEPKGMSPRFFRYPYLHTGMDTLQKKKFEEFLSAHGYRPAPVTIDNSEWIFAKAYEDALAKKDSSLAIKIAEAYIPYMESKISYYEYCSNEMFGRQIKQILLIHANMLNSDCFGKLAQMMENRGYSFISIADALTDPAYASKDTYHGQGGISWIHRWAITKGIKGDFFKREPMTPRFVLDAAGIENE
jgi:peptidoglycan/xylan/chitin deacetylase (PgdA/CDA1 family)